MISASDDLTGRMLEAVNSMLMHMLAAVARNYYDDRRRRQAEGIEKHRLKASTRVDLLMKFYIKIRELREKSFSIRKTAYLAGCGVSTVQCALKL